MWQTAKRKNAVVQIDLGRMYAAGKGVPKDEIKAVELFQQAAGQGNATAQFNLGNMYYQGKGIIRDRIKACALWRSAAEKRDKDAIDNFNRFCSP